MELPRRLVAVGPPTLHLRRVSGVTKEEHEEKGRRKWEKRKRKLFQGREQTLQSSQGFRRSLGHCHPDQYRQPHLGDDRDHDDDDDNDDREENFDHSH